MEYCESSSEPESENDETFLDVPSDEDTIPSYSDFDPDEFSIDDLQIDVEKVDFESDQITEEESEEVESDSHMEFEGSNKIERRSAEEISECIDNKTAEGSVETSENIEKTNVDTSHVQVAVGEEELVEPMSFKLCGDNLDKTVKRRYMRSDEGNLSLHYFHSYAVLDRIHTILFSDSLSPTCFPEPEQIARSLLPSPSDDCTLKQNFAVLISRVLATHMKFFSFSFDDAVQWHILHKFSTEMSKKSTVVSKIIFIIFEHAIKRG